MSAGPQIRLVVDGSKSAIQGHRHLQETPTGLRHAPGLLLSYIYLGTFPQRQSEYFFRDWAMDSGAFTAINKGITIDHQAYLNTCKSLLASDPKLTEVFALDVIGDPDASLRNTETAWAHGIPAIPTYHVGEPESYLLHLKAHYPKIALGGAVGYRNKEKWAEQCFKRLWPHRVHGLGFSDGETLLMFPWHSVDASTWEVGPCKFGRWRSFNCRNLSIPGSAQDLRAEINYFLDLELQMQRRWGPALKAEGLDDDVRVRVVIDGNQGRKGNARYTQAGLRRVPAGGTEASQ